MGERKDLSRTDECIALQGDGKPQKGNDNEQEYERDQLRKIALWKQRGPALGSRALAVVGRPVGWAIRRLIPPSAIEGALIAADWVAYWTLAERQIRQHAEVDDVGSLKQRKLSELDTLAAVFHKWQVGYAFVEGAATGASGLPGIALNVPILITLVLRTIRGVGLCYGCNSDDEQERRFALAVLATVGANSVYEKDEALVLLKELHVLVIMQTFKSMAKHDGSKEAFVVGLRNLARQLSVNLTKRKLLQSVPLVGAGIGASADGKFIHDVALAARYTYQERWLRERYGIPPKAGGTAEPIPTSELDPSDDDLSSHNF